MKFRDNLTIFTLAVTGTALEILIITTWLAGRNGNLLQINLDRFLLIGHAYILLVAVIAYVAGRIIIKPIEHILKGIAQYGRGHLNHRIPSSKIQELDDLANNLNHMAAQLAELDTLKNDFIANVSHELRSPLAAMEDYVKLLLDKADISGKNRENLLRIKNNLSRLRHLVEELLDISQIEARKITLQTERFNILDILRDTCAMFKPAFISNNLVLVSNLPDTLPDVEADPVKVRQILINLIDNAVKYNRSGGKVTVSAATDQDFLIVKINDTGVGIPAEHLDRIFDRFTRLPPKYPETAKVKGAGLGLAISRDLAKAMGGEIYVESSAGLGSTFIFTLPCPKNYKVSKEKAEAA